MSAPQRTADYYRDAHKAWPEGFDYVYLPRAGRPGTLHRAGCRLVAGRRVSWPPYALGQAGTPIGQLSQLAEQGQTSEDARFCRVCLPGVDPLPNWQPSACTFQGCGKPLSDYVHIADHPFIGTVHGIQTSLRRPAVAAQLNRPRRPRRR